MNIKFLKKGSIKYRKPFFISILLIFWNAKKLFTQHNFKCHIHDVSYFQEICECNKIFQTVKSKALVSIFFTTKLDKSSNIC